MREPVANESSSAAPPMRDARLQFVRRTVMLLLLFAIVATLCVSVLHWLDPKPQMVNRVVPPVLAIAFMVLAWRQWRFPERLESTLWWSWWIATLGIAAPAWRFIAMALHGDGRLVDLLPPIGPVFLPNLLVMALLARPRQAQRAVLFAWTVIAGPVLAYLLAHPDELWTPRGLDLVMGFGPLSLFVPLLLPLLRGVEQRFHDLHAEGERLQALAERDVLIGLYNRRAGERFLATVLAHAREDAALILFDIDHFKRINDQHGHPAGDAVLIEVGRRCQAALGRDDIFARWGGEEFLVLLPGSGSDGAASAAERLRQTIAVEPIAPVGRVSASFGVTALRPDDTLGEVVQRADDALYRAKAAGRDRVVQL